jgi:hypothetical protein
MQKRKIIFGILTVGLVVTACEKVIDVPLEESERKVVVEAVFRDNPGDNYVLLSKTGSVYDNSDFEKISDAVVKITDQSGTEHMLSAVSGIPGMYNSPSFQVMTDHSYTLSIVAGTETFTSTSQTSVKPKLDTLTYTEQVGSFGVGMDTTYLVFFNFTDQAGTDNFYKINAWVNGVADKNLYQTNDELFDGQPYSQPLFATTVEKGDTVLVELLSMDKANYTYFFSLTAATSGGGPFAATPANPVSNLEGGAIGYFGAYTTDTMTIIIPE